MVSKLLSALLISIGVASAADVVNGAFYLLDAGKQITIQDSANPGTQDYTSFQNIKTAGDRLKVWLSAINIPPTVLSGSTTTCHDPCTVQMRRIIGVQYARFEEVDSSGTSLSPKVLSSMVQIPQVTSCTASGSWTLPLEVIGQDYYQRCVSFSVPAGSSVTHISALLRLDNLYYRNQPYDGKASFSVNGGSWISINNANSTAMDQQGWYSRLWNKSAQGVNPVTSSMSTINLAVAIPDNLLVANATNTIAFRTGLGDGTSSGFRVLSFNFGDTSTIKTLTQIAVASNVATATCSASCGFANGSSVFIYDAPGMYGQFNDERLLTGTPLTTTFTFAPCGRDVSFMNTTQCTSPNGTYTVPTTRATTTVLSAYPQYAQPVMKAMQEILPATTFTYEDPTTWTAPAGGNSTNGNTKWHTSSLLVAGDTRNGYSISVKCTSCHDVNARDLSYFRFSNWTIENRSIFHNLSWQDGLDIAAYVRSQDATYATSTYARPWSPAYYPGPTMYSQALAEYSAGCGIDCMLTYDQDLYPYLTSSGAWTNVTPTGQINPQQMPSTWEFPNWNQWLPPFHPLDGFPTVFPTDAANVHYTQFASDIAGSSNLFNTYQSDNWFGGLNADTTLTYSQTSINCGDTNKCGAVTAPAVYQQHKLSIFNWNAPKYWEMLHPTLLEGQCSTMYTSVYGASTNGYLTRCLQSFNRAMFNIALHFMSVSECNTWLVPSNSSCYTAGADAPYWDYQSNAWYVMVATTACGNRQTTWGTALDWGYYPGFLEDIGHYYPNGYESQMEWINAAQCAADETAIETFPSFAPSTVGTAFNAGVMWATAGHWQFATNAQMIELVRHWASFIHTLTGRYTQSQWWALLDQYGQTCGSAPVGSHTFAGEGGQNLCNWLAYELPFVNFWDPGNTDASAIATWANTIWTGHDANSPLHNFSTDLAATCALTNGAGGFDNWVYCSNYH